jgi:hypothetical protein
MAESMIVLIGEHVAVSASVTMMPVAAGGAAAAVLAADGAAAAVLAAVAMADAAAGASAAAAARAAGVAAVLASADHDLVSATTGARHGTTACSTSIWPRPCVSTGAWFVCLVDC